MSLAENLLRAYKENNIEETLKTSDSWETLYHLSPMRQNLLEWYNIKENSEILEIGAEAGALTSFLSIRAQKVIALECDVNLLEVNKERNKDLSNVEFRSGTINEIGENERFDYITLIGTLERAFQYCEGITPFSVLVNFCKQHLKEDGILIVAGDNKTGMKFWSGAPENCSGEPFSGITNDLEVGKSRSFSKSQYEAMLKDAGLTNIEFYYPTPDYRFVSAIFSDEYLPQAGELRPSNPVYSEGGYQFFSEDLAYDTVCVDGNYPYFAESFLIFADNKK